MKLISPTVEYLSSWEDFIQECDKNSIHAFWDHPSRPDNWTQYIETEEERKTPKQDSPKIPSSTFWLVVDDEIVATANLRHQLNDRLKKRGGHIGYYVKPSKWNCGYGSRILELVLGEVHSLGIEKILITCSDNNPASARVAEKNGGILEKTELYEGELIRCYWISA